MAFCTPIKSCSLWIEKIPRTGDRVRPRMGIPLVETVIGPSNRRRLWCIIKVAQILVPTCPAPAGRAWSNGNTDSALAKLNWPMRAAVGAIRGGPWRPRKRLCRLSGMPCRYGRARSQCGTAQCAAEVSFFGTACGAFAMSAASWSMAARDNIQDARQAVLDECGKRGKACRIIGASCADGANRTTPGK
jgi:Domain of unknown function (DUF4189)